jgi:MFS family permease
LLFGYDTAVISGAIGYLQTHFDLSAAEKGWAAACALVGCVVGVAGAGFLSDRFGRRNTLIVSAVLFLISASGTATSHKEKDATAIPRGSASRLRQSATSPAAMSAATTSGRTPFTQKRA